MTPEEKSEKDWNKKKEELKKRFILITDKYLMFKATEKTDVSEKLKHRFAQTKDELDKIIKSL